MSLCKRHGTHAEPARKAYLPLRYASRAMNHPAQHDHKHSHHKGVRGFSTGHIIKLLLLNCVLFLACGAFAGMIAGDYLLSDPLEFKIIAAFILVPLAIAVVSTMAHVWASKWTSVDSMSERMFGGKPGPDR